MPALVSLYGGKIKRAGLQNENVRSTRATRCLSNFILHVILCVMSLRDVNCTGWIALVEVLKTMSLFLFTARLAEFQERLDGET